MRRNGCSSASCSAPRQRGPGWAVTKGNVRAVSCPTHFPAAWACFHGLIHAALVMVALSVRLLCLGVC